MIASLVAALAIASDPGSPLQSPPLAAPPASVQQERTPATQLEDVIATGRTLDDLISRYVDEVALPNRHRNLARWDRSVCVGVANLRADAAEYIADRVSTVAEDLGLRAGREGCEPNILVVATPDGSAAAREMTQRRRSAFRPGGAGMDRGIAALRDFVETERPVRWWQVAVPIDSATGARAVRLPGDCDSYFCSAARGSAMGAAPPIHVFAASNLRTQIVDNLNRTIVIVDVDEVANLSILQLADYIAMVSLAQVDPDADASSYASILNVFDDPQSSAGLTDWDQAYLEGLYGAERHQANVRAGTTEVVRSIRAANERLRAEQAAAVTAD
ncbi:hypothetical protein [Brevundimonas sp. FT23028]|uniref:hypothetical protein n=1 Tax=Brevundimonas sp. FT23028 TaxID=3393748 RepID=UPI003B5880E6